MIWLVIGSKGQLGQTFCEVLTTRNIQFVEWSHEQGSVGIKSIVDDLIDSIRPDIIINAAAWTDVDGAESNESEAILINSDAVGYMAAAAKRIGSIFVHFSSDYVFSGTGNIPWSESDEKKPISAYGRSKAQGEDLASHIYPEKTYIFRTSWLYSRFGNNFAKSMTRHALRNEKEILVVGDQIGQPTSALDLANQVVSSIEFGIPFGVYHATNTGQVSWFGYAQEIFKICNSDISRVRQITTQEYPRTAARPAFSVLGQRSWMGTTLSPMRDWKSALRECMPTIMLALKLDGMKNDN